MGTCCSKIDGRKEVCSFHCSFHPSLQKWQEAAAAAASGTGSTLCHFCQVSGAADHSQCCTCCLCEGIPAKATGMEFIVRRSYSETMCSLCAADAYDELLSRRASHVDADQYCLVDDEEENPIPYEIVQKGYILEHTGRSHDLALDQLHNEGAKPDIMLFPRMQNESTRGDRFLHIYSSHDTVTDADKVHQSETHPSICEGHEQTVPFHSFDLCAPLDNSRRPSNIDDSDCIKLEVRYKHMLPHDAFPNILRHTPADGVNVVKMARPQHGQSTEDTREANRLVSHRDCGSLQLTRPDDREALLEYSVQSIDCEDELDDDDAFHDIAIGVSSAAFVREDNMLDDCKLHFSSDISRGKGVMKERNQELPEGIHIPDCVPSTSSDPTHCAALMSQEKLHFVAEDDRRWKGRVNGAGLKLEDGVLGRVQTLSLVSTGDAILLSGGDADEFHLIPSVMFRQEQFLPPLNQNIDIPGTITSTQRCEELLGQNQPLSINNIMLMLENDKLDEDELFTLLVGSCTKSSASSSPLSSTTEVSNVRSSSSSSSSSSMPLSSTSLLQLPTSPTAYSLTLPYSLSLPSSCKMSPDASFEFTAKSSGSTPSTPVFSSINSKARRSNIHLKPSSLTSDDFIDIWGVFEQRQVLISEKHA